MTNLIKINCNSRIVTIDSKNIGISEENNIDILKIELDEEKITENTTAYLEIEFPDGSKKFTEMNKISSTTAELQVKNSLLKQEGYLKLELVLRNKDKTVFKSKIFKMIVEQAINAAETIEEDYPCVLDRLEDLEKKVNDMQFDTFNYDILQNKPKINNVELNGNKELSELGFIEMTNSEIERLLEMED